jgi:hypothetical protein
VLIPHKDAYATRDGLITLLTRTQSLWDTVMPLRDPTGSIPTSLDRTVQEFFAVLLRTVVRLRVVQALTYIKTLTAVASVNQVLLEESQALEAARTTLQVRWRHTSLCFAELALACIRRIYLEES